MLNMIYYISCLYYPERFITWGVSVGQRRLTDTLTFLGSLVFSFLRLLDFSELVDSSESLLSLRKAEGLGGVFFLFRLVFCFFPRFNATGLRLFFRF